MNRFATKKEAQNCLFLIVWQWVNNTECHQCIECSNWYLAFGRPDKMFCSNACRQRAYRKRLTQGGKIMEYYKDENVVKLMLEIEQLPIKQQIERMKQALKETPHIIHTLEVGNWCRDNAATLAKELVRK